MNTLPSSEEMTSFIQEFIAENYSPWSTANDESFTENNIEVYPKSEGGYAIVLYKTRTPVCEELSKIFEFSQDPDSNKDLKALCSKLEKWLDKLDLYKFKAIPGRRLTKQAVSITIYPDSDEEKTDPKDLEKFDIKELTRDSREKQNESIDTRMHFDTTTELFDESVEDDDIPVESETDEYDDFDDDMDPDEKLSDYDDMHAFGYTGGRYNDFGDGPEHLISSEDFDDCESEFNDDFDDDFIDEDGYDAGGHYVGAERDAMRADAARDAAYDSMFESVLKEGDVGGAACDGCTCASDFSGSVPENMGAVVGLGKDDKKFSDVFGD